MWANTVQIIKDQITSGVYEPSAAAYQSCWFCILKQDGKSLCLIHDLQPLNVVTIWGLSTPPFVEHLAESFAGYVVYGVMDLFTGYCYSTGSGTRSFRCTFTAVNCWLSFYIHRSPYLFH